IRKRNISASSIDLRFANRVIVTPVVALADKGGPGKSAVSSSPKTKWWEGAERVGKRWGGGN
nr:hypothetical protein [Nitrospiraceae bacterium]